MHFNAHTKYTRCLNTNSLPPECTESCQTSLTEVLLGFLNILIEEGGHKICLLNVI